ncbi:MAG: putative Rossmann fold enzyme [uncultured archaeon A07HN63]|nr:MAG: putative Rossmann fold enzyme [uncultured archaeon A07HN63]
MSNGIAFQEWEPVYEAMLADFGFDRAADEQARDVAVDLADSFDRGRLDSLNRATVAIVGAAPSLSADIDTFDPTSVDAVLAASTAADVLLDAGLDIDLMVTDLDKNTATARDLTQRGTPVAAHAHGDNIPALREWLPQFESEQTLVTTQAAPSGPVANFGGFTDGDRAAFLAHAFGAAELRFLGWDFDDPAVDPLKARKLRWAEHLLYWLERRRDDQFSVLAGRRESLTTDLQSLTTE